MTDPLAQGCVIGVLGGGQLGRMLAVAAARLGYKTCILDPAGDCPAAHVATYHFKAAYDDTAALRAFADAVDVITFESETIPDAALDLLAGLRPVRPGRAALAAAQDRLDEKRFLQGLGLATAPFAPVDDMATLQAALDAIGPPAILKTRRLGYDGKGQARLARAADAADALAAMGGAPAILEGQVDFTAEVSVIAARGTDGQVAAFDPGANTHRDGILRRTVVPAGLSHARATDAVLLAGRILNALVVNEIAPRVHNSGHWTQNGCAVDQFEQHIRAVTGLPLGDGARHANVEMENLIGADMDRVPALLAAPGVALHLYGKRDRRDGRKLGHANHIRPRG